MPRAGSGAVSGWRPAGDGRVGRLIASLRATDEGCDASVDLVTVDKAHPLARCRGANNAVVITLKNGRAIELRGQGAGRWPTAESVVGDLLELWREREPRPDRVTSVLGEFEAAAS